MKGTFRVGFRTGGGKEVGFGHVRRCMALASELKRLGVEPLFFLDTGDEAAVQVETKGFTVVRIHR